MLHTVSSEAKGELGKFFQLAVQGVENLTMPSTFIDQTWHELLKDQAGYEKFSTEACGSVIGHSENKGEGLITWVPQYEASFGKLNKAWFMNEHGVLDAPAYNSYLETGKWYAGWDCGVIVPTREGGGNT